MLANSFKSAEELKITECEQRALVKVLGMLERGELVESGKAPTVPNGFNMGVLRTEAKCGTVGCILGWAIMVDNQAFPRGCTHVTIPLFTPHNYWTKSYTVAQAAHALRTYLVTGTPDWA